MSFLKSTNQLKIEALQMCNELTNGGSSYDALVVDKLNDAYEALFTGGNEFGIDTGEPWIWAQAKNPITLIIQPTHNTGTVSLTQNSNVGAFSVAPAVSLQGRFLKLSSQEDMYRVATHTAGATAFTLDIPYILASGVFNYDALKLDYDVISDNIVIDSTNNKIDFREDSTTLLTATLTPGVYTPTTLCAEIKTQLEVVGAQTYTVTFDTLTRKFTLAHGGAHLDLFFASGTNVLRSASEAIGFDIYDSTGATSYESTYALNGISRISRPIAMYKEAPTYYNSAKDAGKIFSIDTNTFLRDYPLNRVAQATPDKFCVISTDLNGLWQIRMNNYPLEAFRAEVNYIPVPRKLVDNTASFPLLQGANSKYLVFAAAYFILVDKNDNAADKLAGLATAKLRAMVSDVRKNLSLGGQNFGKLVPRQGQQTRSWGFKY